MRNRLPLVSVGIPIYNRAKGLRRTLECITGQTYKNLEIVVSDNFSPGPEREASVREFMAKDLQSSGKSPPVKVGMIAISCFFRSFFGIMKI